MSFLHVGKKKIGSERDKCTSFTFLSSAIREPLVECDADDDEAAERWEELEGSATEDVATEWWDLAGDEYAAEGLPANSIPMIPT